MANLTNQLIKDTYQYLLQRDGNVVQDGFGNSGITLDLTNATVVGTISTSSYAEVAQEAITAQTASYLPKLTQNVIITGSVVITENLSVLQTASFQYVTASQTLIDQNTITTFAFSPSLPTGGYIVADSSSLNNSSSLLYNVTTQTWSLDRPLSASVVGTASYALQASQSVFAQTASYSVTASYAVTASQAISASYALTASYLSPTATASYALTASQAVSASYASQSLSSSYALTASYLSGSVQVNTGSLATTGSNQFNGSQVITGSLTIVSGSITGSIEGTASYASFALTASYLSGSVTIETGSFATTGSNNFSGSQTITGSLTVISGSITGSLEGTASYASYALTASYLSGSVTIETGSFATTGSNQFSGSQAITGSLTMVSGSITGSLEGTASYALTSSYLDASYVSTASISGSYIVFTKGDGTTFDLELSSSTIPPSASSAVFTFNTASTQWDINHNLNERYVAVTLYNEEHLQIGASQISSSNKDNVSVYFTYPVAGYALVMNGGATTSSGSASESASFATTSISASYAATSSYVLGSIESSSYAGVANSINTLNQTVTLTGSLLMTGQLNNVDISTGLGNIGGNIAIGTTLSNISTAGGGDNGTYNVAIGESSLSSNTTGNYNTATNRSLVFNTTGVWNTAYGYNTMFFNYTGNRNVAIGMWSLANINDSDDNVALGTEAGRFTTLGSMGAASASIFIGSSTRAENNNQTNQIVIGTDTTGRGTDTTTIGNLNTTSTLLRGTVSASLFTGSFQTNGTTDTGSGLFITSPNGTRYKLTIDNSGALTTVLA